MKKSLNRKFSAVLALVLAFALMVGAVPMAVFANTAENDDDKTINYVSLGASNVNGYGMHGYLEEDIYEYPLLKETANIYGYKQDTPGSYPVLIKEHLTDKGYTVNLSQMAISSMRAEEVRFLLDDSYAGDAYTDWRFCDVPGYDAKDSQNWFYLAGKLEWEAQGNTGTPTQEQAVAALKAAYKKAITEADLITVDIGVNNFGVYASNQIVSNLYENDMNTIDPELAAMYAEGKAYVMEVLQEEAGDLLANMPVETLDHMADTMAYALVGFCLSFDAVMEQIYTLNPDATVAVVSIQNLMHGLFATMEGIEEPLPFGDIFGALVNAANMYTAAVSPYCDMYVYADVRQNGHVEFFMDEILAYNGDPSTLSQDMKDCFDVYDNDLYIKSRVQQVLAKQLYGAGLLDISAAVALGADIANNLEHFAIAYQNKLLTIPALGVTFNDFFAAGAAGQLPDVAQPYYDGYVVALNTAYDVMAEIMQAGMELNTLDAASFGENFGPVEDALLGAFFGTLEDAVMASIADPTFSFDLNDYYPEGIYKTLAAQAGLPEGFVNTVAAMGIRTGIGNSFYGHPNGNGQIQLKDTIIAALENETSGKELALKEAIDLIVRYYDDAYAFGYAYADNNGYIDEAVVAIDEAIKAIESIDVSGTEMTDAFKAKLEAELKATVETLKELKAVLESDSAKDVAGLADAVLALEDDLFTHLNNIAALLTQAGVDVNNLVIIPAIEAAIEYTKTVVIPAAKEAAKVAAEKAYEYLMEALGDAFDYLVETTIKYLPIIDEALYNYLYNNPEEVIEFVKTYGPYLLPLIEEYGDEALGLLGVVFYLYGDEIVLYVIDNHEEILEGFNAWVDKYGDRIAAILQVYAEALGLCDAVRDQIAALEAILNNLYAQLENAVEETKAAIEAEIAKVKAQIEELKAQILYQMEVALKQQLDSLEDAVKAVAEAAIADLKALFNKLVYDATHIDATIDNDYKYVALGDATVVAEGYAEALEALLNKGAMENGVNKIDFVNAAIEGNTVANEIANLSADVADADLITLGFSQTEIMAKAMATMLNGETIDWVALVGEDVLPYVESALAEIYAMIDEQNLPADTAASLKYLIEAYAYGIAEYALNLPVLISKIRTVNADAEIVIVGMYNPIDGVVIDINNAFVSVYMDLSDYATYFDYLIDGVAGYSTALAIAIKGVNYVDAREVEIIETNLGISDLEALLDGDVSFMYPGEAGHAYIAEQIYNAMIIEYVSNGILGDADMDGDVDNIDAMLILQYYTGVITDEDVNLGVCDVDGNGAINNVDAMLVLQYYTKEITAFPAA